MRSTLVHSVRSKDTLAIFGKFAPILADSDSDEITHLLDKKTDDRGNITYDVIAPFLFPDDDPNPVNISDVIFRNKWLMRVR